MSAEDNEAVCAAAAIAVAGAVAQAHALAVGDSPGDGGDREGLAYDRMSSPDSQGSPPWRDRNNCTRMSALYGADEAAEVFAKLSECGQRHHEAMNGLCVPPLPRCDGDEGMSRASTAYVPEASSSIPPSARDENVGMLAITCGSGRPVSSVGDSDSYDERQRATSSLHRRQAEWDRQMEFHDQKQGELLTLQWKLMREQTGTLARELAIVQQQLQEQKLDGRRMRTEVDQFLRESGQIFAEERGARQTIAETAEQRLRKVRQELEADLKVRVAPLADVQRRMQANEERLTELSREDRALEGEVAKVSKKVDGSLQDILVLQRALEQEVTDRRVFEDATLDMFRELREALQKESRERVEFNAECASKQLCRISDERLEREQAFTALSQKVLGLQKELTSQKEELPMLRARVQDIEGLMNTRLKDSQKVAERELQDRVASTQKLERRVSELQSLVEKQANARLQQSEDFEQVLKNHRSKTKALVAEQAEQLRQASEELHGKLSDQLERETAIREAQRLDLVDQWDTCRTSMEQRVDSFEHALRNLKQQLCDEGTSATQALEATCLRQMEVLSRQIRDTGDVFQAKLREEKEAREMQDASLEEHVAFMDNFLQDVRQVFLQTGSRTRTMGLRKSVGGTARQSMDVGSPGLALLPRSSPSSPVVVRASNHVG